MKDIVSLRNHLFDALNRLADATENDIEIELQKSAAIVQVSETIIRTAEVENQFIAITKSYGSGFVPVINDKPTLMQLVKTKSEEAEAPKKLFDVDSEENWLQNDGKVLGDQEGRGLGTAKIGTLSPE